jgi:hypothetical protein
MIPESVLGNWNTVNRFVASNIMPVAGYSSGVISNVLSVFAAAAENEPQDPAREQNFNEAYGMSSSCRKLMFTYQFRYSSQEDSTGANSEAIMCLKNKHLKAWGAAENLPTYIKKLVEVVRGIEVVDSLHSVSTEAALARWKVQAFFAESDIMIGNAGERYFTDCWCNNEVASILDFETISVVGTDHESICQPQHGMYKRVFEEMKNVRK